jgi:ATP-dependent RNA helicase RhlE
VTNTSFIELGLAEPVVRALETAHYAAPTPIQARAIPPLLAGKDLLGIAQTGTGKTAAFALPLLQTLSAIRERARPGGARALILAPTRELAIQIAESLAIYGRYLNLGHTVIVGGFAQGPQRKAMARGVDLLVATPGRLLDLINQGYVKLDTVSHLVLDEADRMLDMGFIRDVRKIVAALPRQRQSLLFSATMPAEVERLARQMLSNPIRVEATPEAVTVDRVDQHVVHVGSRDKRTLLTNLLADPALSRVIVFTRTKRGANRLAEHLGKADIVAEALHGNKTQGARQRALERFRTGRARGPRRDRYRRPWHRCAWRDPRGQFRDAQCARELCPSYRTYGARGRGRCCDLVVRCERSRRSSQDRTADPSPTERHRWPAAPHWFGSSRTHRPATAMETWQFRRQRRPACGG